MTYEVGYRRPPKATQFQPGKTGNPKGRPKGSKNFITLLLAELNETVFVTEGGRRKKITRLQAVVKRVVGGAVQGEQKSVLTLIDMMRKTGQLQEQAEPESLLPEGYQAILAEYVKRNSSKKKS